MQLELIKLIINEIIFAVLQYYQRLVLYTLLQNGGFTFIFAVLLHNYIISAFVLVRCPCPRSLNELCMYACIASGCQISSE